MPMDGPETVDGLDLLILGSGVAGLSAAVRAVTRHGLRVGVLTKAELHQSATRWAQGGVAAVLSGGTSSRRADIESDSTDLHLADTLAAGAGLCDADAVRVLVDEGPSRVTELVALGAVFDRAPDGSLRLSREGGHSRARVVHAGGAATGAEIERALVEAVRASATAVLEGWFALDFIVEGGRCQGVTALDPKGRRIEVRAPHTLLATGGAGQLFSVTTNPVQATGDGQAMALRAGVAVADVEFMQFHPTALHHPSMPRPLLSEALRGHGAVLRDVHGEHFVDELATRDQVSRAMTVRMHEQGVEHLWLDATSLADLDVRFPNIAASVREVGLDPTVDWLPVAPAAHYLSGGVVTDLDGASALPGLWACGEVACSGVHGANRLASNSLLEGMVFAPRVIEAIDRGKDAPEATGALRSVLAEAEGAGRSTGIVGRLLPPSELGVISSAMRSETPPERGEGIDSAKIREQLQRAMTAQAGVVRSARSLAEADLALDRASQAVTTASVDEAEVWNLVTLGRALVESAAVRAESRGTHWRRDFPDTDPAFRVRLVHGR